MEPDDGAGQISAGEFGVAFKGFLEQAAAQAPVEPPFFVQRLTEHFGSEPGAFPVVLQDFPLRDHPNVQRALDGYLEGDSERPSSSASRPPTSASTAWRSPSSSPGRAARG